MFSTTNNTLHKLQTLNSEKNHHYPETIFSPYLNSNNEVFKRLGESRPKLSTLMTNKKSPHHNGEIGVFGAEKYFNEEVNTPKGSNKAQQIALETMNYKSQYGTPSIGSESTTNNSQSALLQRNSQRNMKNKVHAKSFLAGVGLKCSCSDKDSVDINSRSSDEISFNKTDTYGIVHGKTTPRKIFNVGLDANHSVKINKPLPNLLINKDLNLQKPENFAFSNKNFGLRNNNHQVKVQLQLEQEEEMARKSLEVFGSPIFPSRDIATAATKFEEIDFPRNSDSNYIYDAASDASSDLFEIESFKEKPNSFLERQASYVASSPKSCYAPSEASIEWSVVTASAAVISDCDEDQMSQGTIRSPVKISLSSSSNGKSAKSKRDMKKSPSMLLGSCKSQKAVRVAGVESFITYEKPSSTSSQVQPHRNNISHVPRFPAEKKLGNFGARHGQKHAYASKLLYI
ncbi:PREDICTED: protein PHYTOCHROME KINASE SUBSTRATE 1-like isoform X2 [Lupinus angustifolius]|uniref:protein PHYTOCHROME KINASE SUBSTRATE 1-like isoform X2 n=1 Tax=Lupinus angustifolius TaxID=3871 RepID=UPI00092ECD91|nr:PREDICTED: protein PHYTOCHROME KINASE SUBSTRATE 1-like isoform X2 [Lupinus angustifolius]